MFNIYAKTYLRKSFKIKILFPIWIFHIFPPKNWPTILLPSSSDFRNTFFYFWAIKTHRGWNCSGYCLLAIIYWNILIFPPDCLWSHKLHVGSLGIYWKIVCRQLTFLSGLRISLCCLGGDEGRRPLTQLFLVDWVSPLPYLRNYFVSARICNHWRSNSIIHTVLSFEFMHERQYPFSHLSVPEGWLTLPEVVVEDCFFLICIILFFAIVMPPS